jgi:hypothetical protein
MRRASQREQSVAGGVGILWLVEYLPVEGECLIGPDNKRSGEPRAYLLGLRLRERSATSPGSISRLSLKSASWIAASSTSGSTIRNAIPAAVSSFRRLSVSDASTTSRWQTVDET